MLAKFEKVKRVLESHRIATREHRQGRKTQQRKHLPSIIDGPR